MKPIFIGVAVLVLGAAIIGSASNTFSNSIALTSQEVKVENLESHVAANTKKTEGIDVMATQIDIIMTNVSKILERMDK
jgi:hypothetical protein